MFSAANWQVPQTATITGVNDVVYDGSQSYTIQTILAAPGDAAYAAIDPADVSVTNIDDDLPGITVTPTAGLTTTEAGGTATFTVVLSSQPSANVSLGLSTSDTTEGTVLPATVIFTAVNWHVPQTVVVTGADDAAADGPMSYTVITAPAVSTDPAFANQDASDVAVTNADDDVAAILVVAGQRVDHD